MSWISSRCGEFVKFQRTDSEVEKIIQSQNNNKRARSESEFQAWFEQFADITSQIFANMDMVQFDYQFRWASASKFTQLT